MQKRLKHIGKTGIIAIALIFNLVLAALTIFSAYGGMIDPMRTSIGALAAMAFPIFLLINLAVLVTNLFLFRKLVAVNILTLLACAGPIGTYCPVNPCRQTSAQGEDTFKLLTYNVMLFDYVGDKYDSDSTNRTISFLLDTDPDIAVLQEAYSLNPLSRWKFNREQVDSLKERFPVRYLNKYGLAILSKYPVDTVHVDRSAFTRSVVSDFTCYKVWLKDRPVLIFNVHLQSIGLTKADKQLYKSLIRSDISRRKLGEARKDLVSKLSKAFRLRSIQGESLRRAIDSVTEATGCRNVIVCGDFNDIPGCYTTRVVKGDDLKDAYAAAGNGPAITYWVNHFYFRIDHIFYGGDFECTDIYRDPIRTSDHYPLVATFRLKD